MKTTHVRPMIRRPPIMRSRLGHTRHGISYLVEFLGVCTLLILGVAVAEVYIVSPPPTQQITSSTTAISQSTSHTSNSETSHGQYSSSVKVQCLPGRTVVSSQVVCTATVTLSGGGGTALTPTGQAAFNARGKGTFKPASCNASAGSLVCTAAYSPNPGSEGTQIVNASYSGDGIITPSSASFALMATKRNSSVSVSCSPSTLQGGASTNCSATVNDTSGAGYSAPVGLVTFLSNVTGSFSSPTCALTSGSCSFSYTPASGSLGSALITAMYDGDSDHGASSNNSVVVFGKRSSSLSVQCAPAQVSPSQIATCQATVLDTGSGTPVTPTGKVFFSTNSHGNFSSPSCTLVGGGCSVNYEPSPGSGGSHILSAMYQGDAAHSSSITSGAESFTLVVVPGASSTAITCNPQTTPINLGTVCTVTVTNVGSGSSVPPSGNVSFSATGPGAFSQPQCRLASGSCSVTFIPGPGSAGAVAIQASYVGDANHHGSTNQFLIISALRSISVSIACSQAASGSTSTCTVTVADTDKGNEILPTGVVDNFNDGGWGGSFGSTSCTLNSGSCTFSYISPTGTSGIGITITAIYEGDLSHASAKGTTTLIPS
jgi:hypothetical protein